jgi:type II secretory pathway pseudopilin PulG
MDCENKVPEWQQRGEHEYYAQLCALCTSDSLTEGEQAELSAHLRNCSSCAQLLLSYRATARSAASLLAPIATAEPATPEKPWSLENAKKQLLNRIEAEKTRRQPQLVPQPARAIRNPFRMLAPFNVAAAVLMLFMVAAGAYRLGQIRGQHVAQQAGAAAAAPKDASRMESLIRQRAELEEKLSAQDREVQRLQEELQRQTATIAEGRSSQEQLEHQRAEQGAAIATLGSEKTALTAQRDAAVNKLQETQDALAAIQQKLDSLEREHNRQLLHVASLQARVDELSSTLKTSDETVQRAEKFLVSDRDIRDLMGARDLYIADVFDIDREGKTQKAFGRVFYTGGKSLIFYAFDLDRQPGVREASTFQAWGRRGPKDKRPLNMGVLYLDSAANRRWVLRFDDPKVLNEIDAVFVTVEPKTGESKPTGKQLLFASLRTPPNHP